MTQQGRLVKWDISHMPRGMQCTEGNDTITDSTIFPGKKNNAKCVFVTYCQNPIQKVYRWGDAYSGSWRAE
jgi:hypothetical protein